MMFQYFTANGVGAILLVLVGVKVNTIKGGQNRTSFGQSERDAMCCCQENNVPLTCLGECMTRMANQDTIKKMKSTFDPPLWMDDFFLQTGCQPYGNIIAGCWSQIREEQCCIELTIRLDNRVDNNTISKFNGHYTLDLKDVTEEEVKNGKFLYTQKSGKHFFYKTTDGVWALGINLKNNSVLVSNCNKTCPEHCSSQFFSEFYGKHNPKERIKLIMGCSAYPNTSGSIPACMQNFNYKQHPNEYLLPKQCGKQKSGWKNSMARITVRHLGSNRKQPKNRRKIQHRSRIIGGRDTKAMDYPWIAALHWPNPNWENIWQCGGTIINNRYILTAAHCVKMDPAKPNKAQVDFVRLGEQKFNQTKDCFTNTKMNRTECADPTVDINVEKIIIHPRYSNTDSQMMNDIALIRLANRINFTDSIRPVCLPLTGDREAIIKGKPLKLAGWGFVNESTDASSKPNTLQEIDLTQRDSEECQQFHSHLTFPDYDFYDQGLICAGGDSDGGKDGCQGDSGSPLMVKNTAKNQVVQVGLMSGSPGNDPCGSPNVTSYYTRVSYYLKWMLDNITE